MHLQMMLQMHPQLVQLALRWLELLKLKPADQSGQHLPEGFGSIGAHGPPASHHTEGTHT